MCILFCNRNSNYLEEWGCDCWGWLREVIGEELGAVLVGDEAPRVSHTLGIDEGEGALLDDDLVEAIVGRHQATTLPHLGPIGGQVARAESSARRRLLAPGQHGHPLPLGHPQGHARHHHQRQQHLETAQFYPVPAFIPNSPSHTSTHLSHHCHLFPENRTGNWSLHPEPPTIYT